MNNIEIIEKNALHDAIENNNIAQLKQVLENKNVRQFINQADKNGQTPLMLAAQHSAHALKLLLAHGANPHIREKNKNLTALLIAIANSQIEMTEIILSEKTIQSSPWILNEALNFAAKEAQFIIVKILLTKYKVQNIPDSQGFTALDYARLGGNESIVKLIHNHFQEGFDADQKRFISQARMIKEYGQIFSLNDVISIKTANSKNYIHLKTESDMPLNIVSLLHEELKQYLSRTPLESKIRQHFEKIVEALLNEQKFLQAEGSLNSAALCQKYHAHKLIIIPSGWLDHGLVEVAFKNRIALCNEGRGLLEGGTKIFHIQHAITAKYIDNAKSTKANDDSWKILPRICEIFNPEKPESLIKHRNKKSIDYTFINMLSSIEAMLYLLMLDEYEQMLQGNNENDLNRLKQEGIYNLHDAKAMALKNAKRAHCQFLKGLRDNKLKELLNLYLNLETSPQDKKIMIQLLTQILASYGRKYYHHPKAKMDNDILRAKTILTSFSEEDRYEVLENLNKEKVDILSLFIAHQDRQFVDLILQSGANLGLSLRQASAKNNMIVVKEILNKIKSDKINEADETGYTALLMAVKKGHHAIVELLLQFGADPKISNRRTKETPLHIAKVGSDNNMIALLSLEWKRRQQEEAYRPSA